jgi:menaquinone-dependent protoporphyrinogen oxidase
VTVLVAYASRHGSAYDIAARIAANLRGHGRDVELDTVEALRAAGRYEAVVIGCSIYSGRWSGRAVQLVREERDVLAARPVWLFSCGPIGDRADAGDLTELHAALPRSRHRDFTGAADLGIAGGSPLGWAGVDAWSADIAHQLPVTGEENHS